MKHVFHPFHPAGAHSARVMPARVLPRAMAGEPPRKGDGPGTAVITRTKPQTKRPSL